MAKTAKTKVDVAKAKARKVKPKKRMSKGARNPWEVWSLYVPWALKTPDKFHSLYDEFKTEKQANACIKKHPNLICPVIRHVEIAPMDY